MKVFLFLYPAPIFFETCIGYPERQIELANRAVAHYGEAIDARYRQRGFQVAWLLFRGEGGGLDHENVDQRVGILPGDMLIDPGMTFIEHCPCVLEDRGIPVKDWPKPIYADLPLVFSQLPAPIDELWIGGHRQSDCVLKVAHHAYFKQGLKGKVHVDEDLTDHGLLHAVQHCDQTERRREGMADLDPFPLIRTERTYEGMGFTRYRGWETDSSWRRARRIRNLQPWFVHK